VNTKSKRLRWSLVLILPLAAAQAVAAPLCESGDLPATMQAVRLQSYGGPDKLQLETVARPAAAPGQLLIQVRSASINPVDWKLREGYGAQAWPLELPAILGRDVSGVVVQVAEGVAGWQCGEQVAAYLGRAPLPGRMLPGGYAEFVAVDARSVVRKPAPLNFDQAAAFPLVAVTAWAALVDTGKLQSGERVLVHGGAGGVGSMAIQLAKARGAHVVTTASARNHEFVRSLGADEAIDYRSVKFEDVVHDIDLVIDTVGGDTTERSPKVLRDGGRLVSIAGMPPPECESGRIACPHDGGDEDGGARALREMAALIDAGQITVHIDRVFPLAQAGAAQESSRTGHTRGKIVLQVSE
jgi:NADPH:quinone reductase-like Zn-dependent oxidoreductase